jgi:hypothetical protein
VASGKTGAAMKFLVFGNDKRVPLIWLKKHGHLTRGVEFFLLGGGDRWGADNLDRLDYRK